MISFFRIRDLASYTSFYPVYEINALAYSVTALLAKALFTNLTTPLALKSAKALKIALASLGVLNEN
ncbi:hypothetical protein [Aliiglaciecola lipolytica]|uniref:Uncharacterized protein n=1 Tax=Aliiglaciecola lipolytica E3 TaxID=1127673 RepID=K6YBC5_9ALTE|nr:hypothetical protein [Aliiglaciecola lipolytica]GAC15487.1 hypothetical protein GLIP_2866 [Aliiglaciecola lipolytica E3]